MYKWFLAWRYLNTKLIAFIGIASVMLCVAMVLVVLSVMGGFLDTVRSRSKGLHSEIVLEGGTLQGFPYYAEFGEFMSKKLPEVVRVTTPVIFTYGIFRVPITTYTKPARVLGVRLDDYVKVNDFKKGLHYERYYPGTTRLTLQQMPVAGFDAVGQLSLPADLEVANQGWRKTETDQKAIKVFDADPFVKAFLPDIQAAASGERVYAIGSGEPGYVGPQEYGIIVGTDLLNIRRPDGNFDRVIARGSDVALTLMPLSPVGNPIGEPPVRLPLRYVDDSRTGIFEIDSLSVYVDFDMLQHQLAMDPQQLVDGGFTKARANQLLIGLQPGMDLDQAKERITDAWFEFRAALGPDLTTADFHALKYVDVLTWEDMQRQFIQAVEKEKVLVTFLFGLISLVAVVLVVCIFYMMVEKKTKDIGILKALGASGSGVGAIFVLYAGAVGILGSALGLTLGSLFVWNINAIQDYLATLNPQLRMWSPDVYSFDRIPEVVKSGDALLIAVLAIVCTMIGSLIPAYVAGRVWPVKALRYE